jgi:CobQ-like glutamine amidotransferase family enzyme
LPKNYEFADELLRLAAMRKFGDAKLTPRDKLAAQKLSEMNELADRARVIAMTRAR